MIRHACPQDSRIGADSLLARIHHEKERRQAALIEETRRVNSYQGLPYETAQNRASRQQAATAPG